MDYTCEECGGSGGELEYFGEKTIIKNHCDSCHGTGQKQITISLEEYDELKLAEKQRDKAIEMIREVYCPGFRESEECEITPCNICRGQAAQAILSYGKED